MNRKSNAWIQGVLVASGVIGAMVFFGLGPLDPPAGPVTATGPSLTDLEVKLDQVLAVQTGDNAVSGPWEVFRVPVDGTPGDSTQSVLVAEGRVYVHSVTGYRIGIGIFDGNGTMNTGATQVQAGNWVARLFHSWSPGSEASSKIVQVDQVVEDGLYVAWDAQDPASYLYVLYKQLP